MRFLSLLFISIFFLISINQQPQYVNSLGTPISFLNHTYQIILFNETTFTVNWNDAAQDAVQRGGYLSTILTQAESNFIISAFNLSTNLLRPFIGGNSESSNGKKFYWMTGPEKGELFFDRDMNKGYLYNYWAANQPDRATPLSGAGTEFYVNLHPTTWNDFQINAAAVLGYVLEKGGENDPYMSGLDTDSTEIIFKNVKGFNKTGITINVVSVNGLKTNFNCPFKSWLSNTSFNCWKHYTMSGEYNITISDGYKTFVLQLVHPNMPYVSSIVPSPTLTAGSIFTINGASFSDSISEVTASITNSLVPCTPIAYILPHRSFTCLLTATLYPNATTNPMLAYISVGVNGIVLTGRTRIPFYNALTDHLIMNGGNFYYEVYNTYKYEGKSATSFTPLYDYSLMGKLENTPQCFNTIYDAPSSSYKLVDTNKSGQSIVTVSAGVPTCVSSVFAGCGTAETKVGTNTSAPIGWLDSMSQFISPNTTLCKLAYILDLPQYNPSFTENPKAYLVSTYGGIIFVPVTGLRLTSSNYTMYQGSRKFQQYLSPNWDYMALEVNIPTGTGSHFMEVGFLNVWVDGRSSGVSQSYIGYLPPTINSTFPAGPPTEGCLLTVFGDSFGADPSKLEITVTFLTTLQQFTFTPTILVPHQQLTFNLIPGSGLFTVKVDVDGQTSTYQSQYGIPIITSHTQNEKILYLTVDNNLVTFNESMISISLNSIEISPINYIDFNNISVTLPDNSFDGPLLLTIDGLVSEVYNLTLKPILNDIEWVKSGELTNITGNFIYEPSLIKIGSFECNTIQVTSTQLISCIPIGNGIDLSTTIKLENNLESNSIMFSFSPIIDTISNENGLDIIQIQGDNFKDSDAIVLVYTSETKYTTSIPTSITSDLIILPINLSQKNTFISVQTNTMTTDKVFMKLQPLVTSITSISTEGGEITILGNYFNFEDYLGEELEVVVNIGLISCLEPKLESSSSNQKLLCTVPPGSGSNINVTVSVDSVLSNSDIQFSYGKPSISNAIQSESNLKTLVISGENFGTEISDITVYLNELELECEFNPTFTLLCTLNQSNSGGLLSVKVIDQVSDNFTLYLIPILTSTKPISTINTSITINGWFLRSNDIITEYVVDISGIICDSVSLFTNQDYLICILSNNSVLSSSYTPNITVIIEDLSSNTIPVEFSVPSITKITQNALYITIQGNTLGNLNSQPIISIGSNVFTNCNFLFIQSEINCSIPLSSKNGNLNISNYNGFDVDYISFTPILSGVLSTPTQGGLTDISGLLLNDIFDGTTSLSLVTIHINEISQCSNIKINSIDNIITCNVPVGLPDNSTFKLIISTNPKLQSNSIVFNYLPPLVTNYTQNQFILTISGENFGEKANASFIDMFISNIEGVVIRCNITIDHVEIQCDLESQESLLLNGYSTLKRRSISSIEDFYLNLKPILTESTKCKTKGGLVTITGNFLSLLDSNGDLNEINISTNLNGLATAKESINSNSIVISIPEGSSGTSNQLSLIINNQTSNTIEYSVYNPSISQSFTNGKLYYPGAGGYVTILGDNFINQNDKVSVTIGGHECTQPLVDKFSRIICLYDNLVEPVDEFGIGIIVTSDGLESEEAFVFLYDDNIVCKGTPQCSGNGNCYNGACVCTGSFTGPTCQIEIDGSSTKPTPPDTIDPNGATFSNYSVFFTHIREIETLTGNVAKIYPVSNLQWNVTTNTTSKVISIGKIPDTDITVDVTTTLFLEAETIHFAGEAIQMSKNSLKYQMSIKGWEFSSKFNTLEIIYSLQVPLNQKICEEVLQSNQTIDNQDDIRTITVELNGQIFISQFSKRIYSDGRVTTTTTKLLDKSDSIYQTDFYQSRKDLTVVSLITPSFQDSTVIDPSFQLLLQSDFHKTTSDTCSSETEKKSLWWISLIVVGGVGGGAAAIGAIIYRRKKLKESKFKISLRSIN